MICATASFKDKDYAPAFGAQLSGAAPQTFIPITGTLNLRPAAARGSKQDAEVLSSIDLAKFYEGTTEESRLKAVQPMLDYRRSSLGDTLEEKLYNALAEFPPLSRLVNSTMQQALRVSELGKDLFPDALAVADSAVTTLLALGSMARIDPKGPGLLPCRIHNFYRGLPGLWACTDPNCSEIAEEQRSGICGRMYAQPHGLCECGAKVFEFFTCRFCGTAYVRAYSDDVDNPSALWSEQGRRMHMEGIEVELIAAP